MTAPWLPSSQETECLPNPSRRTPRSWTGPPRASPMRSSGARRSPRKAPTHALGRGSDWSPRAPSPRWRSWSSSPSPTSPPTRPTRRRPRRPTAEEAHRGHVPLVHAQLVVGRRLRVPCVDQRLDPALQGVQFAHDVLGRGVDVLAGGLQALADIDRHTSISGIAIPSSEGVSGERTCGRGPGSGEVGLRK